MSVFFTLKFLANSFCWRKLLLTLWLVLKFLEALLQPTKEGTKISRRFYWLQQAKKRRWNNLKNIVKLITCNLSVTRFYDFYLFRDDWNIIKFKTTDFYDFCFRCYCRNISKFSIYARPFTALTFETRAS